MEPEQLEQVMQLLQALGELAEQNNLDNPNATPNAEALDSVSLHEFVANEFKDDGVSMLVNEMSKSLVGLESSESSALYFLDTIKRATGLANIISDGKNGGQYLRNRQGRKIKPTVLTLYVDLCTQHIGESCMHKTNTKCHRKPIV